MGRMKDLQMRYDNMSDPLYEQPEEPEESDESTYCPDCRSTECRCDELTGYQIRRRRMR